MGGQTKPKMRALLWWLILAQILLTAALNAHEDDSSTEAVSLGDSMEDLRAKTHELSAKNAALVAKNAALVAKNDKLEAAATVAESAQGLGEDEEYIAWPTVAESTPGLGEDDDDTTWLGLAKGFGGAGGGLATSGSFSMMGGGGWEENEALSDTRLGESVASKGRKGKKKAGGKKKAAAKKPKKAAPKKGKVAKAKAATKDAKSAANTLAVKGSDPGAPARCKQTHGEAPGHLDCKPTQDKCEVAKFTQNKAACVKAWGGKISCPDGISSKGVFLTEYCAKWSSSGVAVGTMLSRILKGAQVATKALVKHVRNMSKNSGMLLLKRAVCKNNKCAVYKSGLCVDVGKAVWSHIYNDRIKDPKGEAMKFAKEAEKLLVRYKDKLPVKHLCSDTRHPHPSIPKLKLQDANLGKTALFLF